MRPALKTLPSLPAVAIEDAELMRRVAARDMAAYRQLVDRHTDRCLRTAYRMLGNRQDAEDIVQDLWLKLWNDAPRWEPRAKLTTWLYRVVSNACIDQRRKFGRVQPADMELVVDERIAVDEDMMDAQRGRNMALAVSRLGRRQRIALVLSYYEGLGSVEVAEILGIKINALQALLHRSRQELKKQLKE